MKHVLISHINGQCCCPGGSASRRGRGSGESEVSLGMHTSHGWLASDSELKMFMGERCVWLHLRMDRACSGARPGLTVALVSRRWHYQGQVGFDVTGLISDTTGNQLVDEMSELPQGLMSLFQRIVGNLAAHKESCTKEICLDFL